MLRTFCALLLLAVVLAACGSDDSASPPPSERLFFLLSSHAGELHDQGDGTYLLRLTQAWDTVVEFSDRPFRDAATTSLDQWVENWAAYGFAADPPNAAITMLIDGSVEVIDSAIMTLTNPRVAADGALEFDAEFLLLADGSPAFFPTDLGSGVKPSFLTTQVFIDSTAFWCTYRPVRPDVGALSCAPCNDVCSHCGIGECSSNDMTKWHSGYYHCSCDKGLESVWCDKDGWWKGGLYSSQTGNQCCGGPVKCD